MPFTKREELVSAREESECPYDPFMVVEYTPDLNVGEIAKTLRPTTQEEDTVPKPCLSLSKDRNLRRTLVPAKLKEHTRIHTGQDHNQIPIPRGKGGKEGGGGRI